MLDVLWSVASFIVAIGVLVSFHEFGHFWVARRCGVKVLRFSIGFGRPLFGWKDRQGCEYVVAAIPLGGYVKMLDEREGDVPEALLSQTFNRKSVWARIAIVAARGRVRRRVRPCRCLLHLAVLTVRSSRATAHKRTAERG